MLGPTLRVGCGIQSMLPTGMRRGLLNVTEGNSHKDRPGGSANRYRYGISVKRVPLSIEGIGERMEMENGPFVRIWEAILLPIQSTLKRTEKHCFRASSGVIKQGPGRCFAPRESAHYTAAAKIMQRADCS